MSVPRIPSVDELQSLLERAGREGAPSIVLQRIECVLSYRRNLLSVAETCRKFGIARGTFYRIAGAIDSLNWKTLLPKSRCPNILASTHLSAHVAGLVRAYRQQFPSLGKEAIRLRLALEHSVVVSASAVGRLIAREKLFFADSLLHERKREDHHENSIEPSFAVLPALQLPVAQPQPSTSVSKNYRMRFVGFAISFVLIASSFVLGREQGMRQLALEKSILHAAAEAQPNAARSLFEFTTARQ